MKSTFTTIALAATLALIGTTSFAGSGNQHASEIAPAAPAAVVIASADTASSSSFDPLINVRVNGEYLLPSV